jgi:hypothetical protein
LLLSTRNFAFALLGTLEAADGLLADLMGVLNPFFSADPCFPGVRGGPIAIGTTPLVVTTA